MEDLGKAFLKALVVVASVSIIILGVLGYAVYKLVNL